MANVKVRLECSSPRGREHVKTIEVSNVPRVGEKIQTSGNETYEVVDVVHTPLIRDWDAVVIVKVVAAMIVASASYWAA